MTAREWGTRVLERWPAGVRVVPGSGREPGVLEPDLALLPELCGWLFADQGFAYAGAIVEEREAAWELRHAFHDHGGLGLVHVLARQPLERPAFPSISGPVHAADWHEREAEDLFGIVFEGHPRLGDFVLHDDAWQEGVAPMRRRFDAHAPVADRRPREDWRPRRIVHAPGSFVMPVGPVYAAGAESVHFHLETVGEDVIRAFPRLFYKYRGIEKLAEGRAVTDGLLLAERFSATTAFAHGLAYCRAVEAVAGVEAPPRAATLRMLLAELERFRHHAGAIAGICESTALAVAASQAALLEEDLLRVSGALTGHRYLFGWAVPGGLAADLETGACREAARRCAEVLVRLETLERRLRFSSSFLDRIEEVGIIETGLARSHGLVGPIARASGVGADLRTSLPYTGYERFGVEAPVEAEGDGYARLRILFREARESVRLIAGATAALEPGPVRTAVPIAAGTALGWVEAPRGAAFHWTRIGDDGRIQRYRVIPPSFTNWHGFHLSVENFAFQDFPIILATLDLSVAENDR